jgi:sn-glycerol 3-phosphate transport system ATP-binding protein
VGTVHLYDLRVAKDGKEVLHGIDLRIDAGERLAVLGPSGAGKSTLLRAVAGLDTVSGGQVVLGGRDVTSLPTREREVSMVSQTAALYRHLDVAGNVAFPLWVRGVASDEREQRVEAEARAFSLSGLLRRKPRTLSQGEQHEVALARSLVRRGGVLLLDEPLAQADAPRRGMLVQELIRIQEGYGVTLLVATNDQHVAMSLAHRCAVLHEGRLVQVASPMELYTSPATTFVAGFLGSPSMNLLPGRVERLAGRAQISAGPFRIPSVTPRVSRWVGSDCILGVRPHDLHRATGDELILIEEVVRRRAFLGARIEVVVGPSDDPADQIVAMVDRPAPRVGELLQLSVPAEKVHVFAPDGQVIAHGV